MMFSSTSEDIFEALSRKSPYSTQPLPDLSLCHGRGGGGGNSTNTNSELGSAFTADADVVSSSMHAAQLVHAFSIDSEDIIGGDDIDVDDAEGAAAAHIPPSSSHPSGIAISKSGDYIVIDSKGKQGKVFNPAGYKKYCFGVGMLDAPWDIFVSETGKIVVSDSTSGELKVFSSKGKFLQSSELGCHLVNPKGIAYHPITKELLVSDPETCCVYVHNPAGIVTDVLTLNDHENFIGPSYVHVDKTGNIYISDTAAHRIHVFDAHKHHRFSYGSRGSKDGELRKPAAVCTDRHGNILVADTGNSRVHLLDGASGMARDYLLTWEDGLVDPQAMLVDADGHLVVSEASSGLVKVYAYEHMLGGTEGSEEVKDDGDSQDTQNTL